MLRRLLVLLFVLLIAPTVWLRDAQQAPDRSQTLTTTALAIPANHSVGPFRLTGAWLLTSTNTEFGGYSALIVPKPGWLAAFGDSGSRLDLPQPGQPGSPRQTGVLAGDARFKGMRDVEAATRDSASDTVWLALEGRNSFLRLDKAAPVFIGAPGMVQWGTNSGPEAMTRLSDGRFLALAEGTTGWGDSAAHPALVWPSAPEPGLAARPFRFIGPDGYRPTDMAQLPDGRVLIVTRRLLWPMPPRFSTRLVLADPAAIVPGGTWAGRELASLDGTGLEENYEGIAIEPLAGGRVAVWLISDANGAVTQRTLLLRLELDPATLPAIPAKQKAPG